MADTFTSIEDSMPSLEFIAAVKVAIQLCCDHELKKLILYTRLERRFLKTSIWHENVEEETRKILTKMNFIETLQEKVVSAVFVIGVRMKIWAEYHEGTLGFSREFSLNFIDNFLFTSRGVIDTQKVAKQLMDVDGLSIPQKYKIACLYCFVGDIPVLFRQMSSEDVEEHSKEKQPALVRHWTLYLKGEVDETSVDRFLLEKALENGSKATVEHCFEQAILKRKEFDAVTAALEAVRNMAEAEEDCELLFRKHSIGISYVSRRNVWVPNDYYVDIVLFLLSKMNEVQQIEFLQKDVEGVRYEREPPEEDRRSRVLEYLLNSSSPDKFMIIANLIWDFLPKKNYADLILQICAKIRNSLFYGHDKFYDYRRLFMKFWHQSPELFKRYVFSERIIKYGASAGVQLLKELLEMKNFTRKDAELIGFIFASALKKEKQYIFASIHESGFLGDQMGCGKWLELDVFAVNLLSTKEKVQQFKRAFIYSEEVKFIYMDFLFEDNWIYITESLIEWSDLPEEEIVKLKKEMIDSPDGRHNCANLVWNPKFEKFEKLMEWGLLSAEERKIFKKKIGYSDLAMKSCAELTANGAAMAVDQLTDFFFSSEEEITQFRKDVADRVGVDICSKLISGHSGHFSLNVLSTWFPKMLGREDKFFARSWEFLGGKWEEVEKFLTWIFSSEKEIEEFKKKKIKLQQHIHHNLILYGKFDEAERYFAWLGLSAEEIKKVKRDDFFSFYLKGGTFQNLFYTKKGMNIFPDFESVQLVLELLLRWYLTDRDAVLEFRAAFRPRYLYNDDHINLDSLVAQLISDSEEEENRVKRKSEKSSSSKRFCK